MLVKLQQKNNIKRIHKFWFGLIIVEFDDGKYAIKIEKFSHF